MKQVLTYALIAAVIYFAIKVYSDNAKYLRYLQSVGLPNDILKKMSSNEIKASAIYLKRYAKTNQHFATGDDDYEILAAIRAKYGIFA